MNVLITGHKGFIGAHLERALRKGMLFQNHAILERDEVITSDADIRDLDSEAVLAKIDRIYHLAGSPSPVKYKQNPIEVIMSTVQGTYNVLELARKTGARVLFASTIDTDKYYPPTNPRAAYTDSKKVAEDLCYQYRNDVDIRVARLFSTYGPGMLPDDGRVVPAFILAALNGTPISVYGDGTQIDSFCYITDMIQGLYKLMENENPGKPVELGNPFIMGPGTGLISIGELARMIIELCESRSGINFINADSFDRTRIPDMSYAKSKLDWYPVIGIRQGLEKTVKYMREVTT